MIDRIPRSIENAVDGMIREIMVRLHAPPTLEESMTALWALFSRVGGSWHSICVLVNNVKTEEELQACANDCAGILRCMFDAYLQAAYIQTDPANLGRLYLEYKHVERYRVITETVSQQNSMAKRFADSPRRPAMEPEAKENYDRVKHLYQKRPGERERNHWYKGHLRAIAQKVGKEAEYHWFITLHNSSIHSGPLATLVGPSTQKGRVLEQIALWIVCSTAKLLAADSRVNLSEESQALVDHCAIDILNLERPSPDANRSGM